ncbi:MAG: hypothetical protein GY763_11735 [Gammaproteobacteria bacterium]|nr:hypothetical protein [Gammaproteobacteria bacterium]
MNGPSILNGIGFAIITSLASGVLGELLPILLTPTFSSLIIVLAISLAYLIYLFRHCNARRGRIVTLALWCTLSICAWTLDPGLLWQIALQLAFIWLVRSFYYHGSIFGSLLDLALVVMASAAGIWAILQTGSFAAAVWCFFLAQSLFVAIPELNRTGSSASSPEDRFQNAHRVALQAVRKLSLN